MIKREIVKKNGCEKNRFKDFEKLSDILFNAKYIKYPHNPEENKVSQLHKILKKMKFKLVKNSAFPDLINENIALVSKSSVIGNMPVDYSIVINYSINELRRLSKFYDNDISRQNVEILNCVEEHITLLCREIEKSNMSEEEKKYYGQTFRGFLTNRAQSLEDALQRIFYWNQLLWQTGHSLMGLGRLDKVLDGFSSEADGKIIKDFLCALHRHYSFKSNVLLGDTGQIIVLGGKEQDGSYFHNIFTELFIATLNSLHLPDPKILLRVSRETPQNILEMASRCIFSGVGYPILSNDDVIVDCLIDFGYSREDAFEYGVSACWEPLVIGKSLDQNNMECIEFGNVMNKTIMHETFSCCDTLGDVKKIYFSILKRYIDDMLIKIDSVTFERDPLITLFTRHCLECGKDISQGGAEYNNYGITSVGLSAAVDSLLNIQRLVFKENQYSLDEIQKMIRDNYMNFETEENLLKSRVGGFGTDNSNSINLTNEILGYTSDLISGYRNQFGGKCKFGLSAPSYIDAGKRTGATADGRRANTPFNTHISRDINESPTELVRFAGSVNYNGTMSNGNVVDMMVPTSLTYENLDKFISFINGSIKSGIYQEQFNVLSYEQLIDAKTYPDKYPDLIVRVWGFSAYFKDLPSDYQELLIRRAKTVSAQ